LLLGLFSNSHAHTTILFLCRALRLLPHVPFSVRYVAEAKDPALCRECARILEGMQTVADTEAASLYELGGQFDRAAVRRAKDMRQALFALPALCTHYVGLLTSVSLVPRFAACLL
jgi:hypothetical protein